MRRAIAVIVVALLAGPLAAKPAVQPLGPGELSSLDAVQRWMNAYRVRHDLVHLPDVVPVMGQLGAFRDPDAAGVYVGFLAGILGGNADQVDGLIVTMLTLPPADQWAVVRAIAYSGLPNWKELLTKYSDRIPTRKLMIDKYLSGKMPTLDRLGYPPPPGMLAKMRDAVDVTKIFSDKSDKHEPEHADILEPSPALLDTLWGYYFATGTYLPAISRIVSLLPLANDHENADKMTVGMMAKYTLATNASRDANLMNMLKQTSPHHPKKLTAQLGEVIEAAETVDTAKLRKDALASIDDLKTKGPQSRRNVSTWGKIGEGAIGIGCVAAAAAGQVELGLPCVVGGAVTSAALKAWGN